MKRRCRAPHSLPRMSAVTLGGWDGPSGGASRAVSTCAQLGARPEAAGCTSRARRRKTRVPERGGGVPRAPGAGGWEGCSRCPGALARPGDTSALRPDPQVSEEAREAGRGRVPRGVEKGLRGLGTPRSAPVWRAAGARGHCSRDAAAGFGASPGTTALALRRTAYFSTPKSVVVSLARSPKSQVRSLPLKPRRINRVCPGACWRQALSITDV